MSFITKEIQIQTKKSFDIIDITDQVQNFLQEIKAKD
jgi:thiamine phosphate synthase YjbQ (UPF0047 family)